MISSVVCLEISSICSQVLNIFFILLVQISLPNPRFIFPLPNQNLSSELNVCIPLEFMFEALTPSMAVFGGGAPKKIIKVNWIHKSGALIQQDYCPTKKRHQRTCSLSPQSTEERPWSDAARRKANKIFIRSQICQDLDNELLLVPRTVRNKFVYALRLWDIIMTVQTIPIWMFKAHFKLFLSLPLTIQENSFIQWISIQLSSLITVPQGTLSHLTFLSKASSYF